MLALIREEALNSEQLSQVLALDPNIIAKHLTYLRDGGVVTVRRRGKITYYSVRAMATCAESQLVHLTLDLLRLEPYMDGEFAMLKAMCEREAECQDADDSRVSLSAQNVIDDLSVSNDTPATITAHVNQAL
jgi:predicted ArsR family transcriptional regulator